MSLCLSSLFLSLPLFLPLFSLSWSAWSPLFLPFFFPLPSLFSSPLPTCFFLCCACHAGTAAPVSRQPPSIFACGALCAVFPYTVFPHAVSSRHGGFCDALFTSPVTGQLLVTYSSLCVAHNIPHNTLHCIHTCRKKQHGDLGHSSVTQLGLVSHTRCNRSTWAPVSGSGSSGYSCGGNGNIPQDATHRFDHSSHISQDVTDRLDQSSHNWHGTAACPHGNGALACGL